MNTPTTPGFSIIELLIIVAVIGLMSSLVTVRLLSRNDKVDVENATLLVSAHVKDARSHSLSGQTVSATTNGWGVYADVPNQQLELFADTNGDAIYSSGDYTEQLFLEDRTQLIECKLNATQVDTCGVFFASPSAQASFFTGSGAVTDPLTALTLTVGGTGNPETQGSIHITAPAGVVSTQLP